MSCSRVPGFSCFGAGQSLSGRFAEAICHSFTHCVRSGTSVLTRKVLRNAPVPVPDGAVDATASCMEAALQQRCHYAHPTRNDAMKRLHKTCMHSVRAEGRFGKEGLLMRGTSEMLCDLRISADQHGASTHVHLLIWRAQAVPPSAHVGKSKIGAL